VATLPLIFGERDFTREMTVFGKFSPLLAVLLGACAASTPGSTPSPGPAAAPPRAAAPERVPVATPVWVEQGAVLEYGPEGSWDDKPMVVEPIGIEVIDGIYYLFYVAGFDGCWVDEGSHASIGLATSTDGIRFEKFSGNPVLRPHDFVPIESHEEGIRTASIRYLPDLGLFLGYFGIESPGGAGSCAFGAPASQCRCNIEVDSVIYAATSVDGRAWSVLGDVAGVGNGAGRENYVDDFLYQDGRFTLWSHLAQGGQMHFVSQGDNFLDFGSYEELPQLCWGWSQLRSWLHADGDTVTLLYDPQGGCAPNESVLVRGETSLRRVGRISSERVIHDLGAERTNILLKDTGNDRWLWFYNKSYGPDRGSIQLRTTPIASAEPPWDLVAPVRN
jgi:hypothetical protein